MSAVVRSSGKFVPLQFLGTLPGDRKCDDRKCGDSIECVIVFSMRNSQLGEFNVFLNIYFAKIQGIEI
ncbi:hypothetical protein AB1L42_11580 [Thalassoglobus sp. JC818]|uniref:hypothetical protein n=1 Tax=Thalassoglobus sp. JC818 TaxID=3232136 RepID=UPI003459FCD8